GAAGTAGQAFTDAGIARHGRGPGPVIVTHERQEPVGLRGLDGLLVEGSDEPLPLPEHEPEPAVALQLGSVLLVRGELRVVGVDGEQQVGGRSGVVPRGDEFGHGLGPAAGGADDEEVFHEGTSYAGTMLICGWLIWSFRPYLASTASISARQASSCCRCSSARRRRASASRCSRSAVHVVRCSSRSTTA